MDCPLCNEAMVTFELNEVEIDYCFGCKGIWLDEGELELLIDNSEKSCELLDSFKIVRSSEKSRRCPICFKKMKKILATNSTKELLIDKCPKNHGFWFDENELTDILEIIDLPGCGEIKKILKEMFNYDSFGETT